MSTRIMAEPPHNGGTVCAKFRLSWMSTHAARVAPENTDFSARPAVVRLYAERMEKRMSGNSYAQKLRDPRWQKKRLEIMGRDEFACRMCGDRKSTLNVHHIFYTRGADPWDYPDTALVTTCNACHEELHVSDFGPRIVEALIAGGAGIPALSGVATAITESFNDGPAPIKLDKDGWVALEGALVYVFRAIANGARESDIRAALKRFWGE